MNQNKVSSYILYALGEIILVMIGIILALQVNNWNENRKEFSKERQILNSLANEVHTAVNQIDDYAEIRKKYEYFLRDYLDIVSDSRLSPQEKAARPIPGILGRQISFRANYLISIISSGEINTIRNNHLKEKLTEWLNNMNDLVDTGIGGDEFRKYLRSRRPQGVVDGSNMKEWVNISSYTEDELSKYRISFVEDFYFQNLLKGYINSHYIKRRKLLGNKENSEQLLVMLNSELEK